MQSTMMAPVRQRGCASKAFNVMTCAAAVGSIALAMTVLPASALTGAGSALQHQLGKHSPIVEVVARRGAAPAPGYCWLYTDPSERQGSWDVCP
jgi:hypothetical protein